MLVDRIIGAKHGSAEAMEDLLTQFEPILKKYSKKLFWEDAFQDMTLSFIELIHKFPLERMRSKDDGSLVKYIARSIYNIYVMYLDQYFHMPHPTVFLDDSNMAQTLLSASYEDKLEECNFIDLIDTCPELTEKERRVLILIYYWGYTSTQIAKSLSTSKQNINQIKRRALEKMKKKLQ